MIHLKNLKIKNNRRKYGAVALSISTLIILSLVIMFLLERHQLANRQLINDDAAQYIFPFYKIQDQELFNNDIFTDYSLYSNSKISILIYYVFSTFSDPLVISKILPIILLPLSIALFFLFNRKFTSKSASFIASVFFLSYTVTANVYPGGYARALILPMLIIFLNVFFIKKTYTAILIAMLSFFTYPPVALIMFFTIILSNIHQIIIEIKSNKKIISKSIFSTAAAIICLFSALQIFSSTRCEGGGLFSFTEMLKMPEFSKDGRCPFFTFDFSSLANTTIAERITGPSLVNYNFIILLLISIMSYKIMKENRRKLPLVLLYLILSSFILYGLSWLFLLHLFFPGRYLKYTLPVFLIIISSEGISIAVKNIFKQNKNIGLAIITLAIIIINLPFFHKGYFYFKNTDLYEFLSKLPKDSVIAAHPKESNGIPVYAKRKVFIESELSLPFYKNYYLEISKRTYIFFKLYYSDNIQNVKDIANSFGIDYIIINRFLYTNKYLDRQDFYYEPFNSNIKTLINSSNNRNFALENPPPNSIVWKNNRYMVAKTSLL